MKVPQTKQTNKEKADKINMLSTITTINVTKHLKIFLMISRICCAAESLTTETLRPYVTITQKGTLANTSLNYNFIPAKYSKISILLVKLQHNIRQGNLTTRNENTFPLNKFHIQVDDKVPLRPVYARLGFIE